MKTENNTNNNDSFPPRVSVEEIFKVPSGYFEQAKTAIQSGVNASSPVSNPWPRYLVAASIAVTFLIAGYILSRETKEPAVAECTQEDLAYGVQLEGVNQDLMVLHLTDSDLETMIAHEDQDAIQDYLLENQIDINHINLD